MVCLAGCLSTFMPTIKQKKESVSLILRRLVPQTLTKISTHMYLPQIGDRHKTSLYPKAIQVYDIPNLYPVTFSPSISNLSSDSQEYKSHFNLGVIFLLHM